MRENEYQMQLKKRIKSLIPGCVVIKNDPSFQQGFPDLAIFYKDRYAVLEVKRSADAEHQPNQDYYVSMFNDWSYSAFIYPENEKEVLDDLQRALEHKG
jgi:hypothetical protein